MTLIKATLQEERLCTWYGDINEDIKQALCNRPTWEISFIHREGNGVAHSLAKLGYTFTSGQAVRRTILLLFPNL